MRTNLVLLVSICAVLGIGCGESSSSGTGGGGGAGGTEPVDPGPTCIAFCMKAVGQCEAFSTTEESCRQNCQRSLDAEYEHAEPCGAAAEDVFTCAAELDCQGVYDWRDQTPRDSFPCRSKVLVFDELIAEGVCLGAS